MSLDKKYSDMLGDIMFSTFREILACIVKANITEPENLGRALMSYELHTQALDELVAKRKKQPSKDYIQFEEEMRYDYVVLMCVCYRFFMHFGDTDEKKEQWTKFYQQHEDLVNDYKQRVCNGAAACLREYQRLCPGESLFYFPVVKEIENPSK